MQAVILAAGASSRFWPLSANRHKCLFTLCGRPLIEYTLESLEEAGIDSVVIVQSPDGEIQEEVRDGFDFDLSYVVQEQPRGMGHALRQAEPELDETFLVLTPYRANAATFMEQQIRLRERTDASSVLLARETEEPWNYGILELDGDMATGIVEKPDRGEEPSLYRVVGMYLLSSRFFDYLDRVQEHEYQFEDALDLMMDEEQVRVVTTTEDTASIKYPWDLFDVASEVFADQEPRIAADADVADSAVIEGNVVVESGAKIYENAVIRGPCYIGEDCVVGNNAVVRDRTALEEGVVVGANSEVRGSLLQQGTHTHQAFIGDSLIGREVRIGAGTVFANRNVRDTGNERSMISSHLGKKDRVVDTGRDRLGGIVGDYTDIGTQANIMPGVQIGANAFVGPSTCLFETVASGETIYTETEYTRRER
ncbi:MAG: bifunctional sugar-1-phosphate nucleotidylyltransferase/acetyltransferase [Candidatus Nanohaloarchaea archaeon]|nr:bifunctional sugar-1-phosphate nucleotidylyltransferase/acetyltransferase [Candidatus Nanohaloarchaea archaeon]